PKAGRLGGRKGCCRDGGSYEAPDRHLIGLWSRGLDTSTPVLQNWRVAAQGDPRTAFWQYIWCMPSIGPLELGIILLIVLVVFGPKRLPGLGRQLGSGMREFKDSITGKDKDDDEDDDAF